VTLTLGSLHFLLEICFLVETRLQPFVLMWLRVLNKLLSSINALALERFMKCEINLSPWEHRALSFAHITTLRSELWGGLFYARSSNCNICIDHVAIRDYDGLTVVSKALVWIMKWCLISVAQPLSLFGFSMMIFSTCQICMRLMPDPLSLILL
jgi:hypothetical protein